MTNFFLQSLIDALTLGSVYAITAIGIGILFGVMRLINFAYGDYITLGGFALLWPGQSDKVQLLIGSWPWFLIIPAIVLIVVLFAMISERVVFRPSRGADATTLMVGSFALSYFVQNLILMIYGGRAKGIDLWSNLAKPVEIFGLSIPQIQIISICVAVALLVALALMLKFSRLGLEIRASAENFNMARLLGVNANQVILVAFAISGAIAAAMSLVLVTQIGVVNLNLGTPLMLVGFVAVVVGGLGSLPGAALGGFLIGMLIGLLQAYLPADIRPYRDAFAYGAVILVLLVKPNGILGSRALGTKL